MKRTRVIITVILTFALILSATVSVHADAKGGDWDIMRKAQQPVTGAWRLFRDLVIKNGYPDDYAGAWTNDDGTMLFIAFTEGADLTPYQVLLKDYDCVTFITHKYSLNTLEAIEDKLFNKLLNITLGAGYPHIDEAANIIHCVTILSPEEATPLVLQAMLEIKEEEGLPDGIENALKVEYAIIEPTWDDEPEDEGVSVDRPQEALRAYVVDETV